MINYCLAQLELYPGDNMYQSDHCTSFTTLHRETKKNVKAMVRDFVVVAGTSLTSLNCHINPAIKLALCHPKPAHIPYLNVFKLGGNWGTGQDCRKVISPSMIMRYYTVKLCGGSLVPDMAAAVVGQNRTCIPNGIRSGIRSGIRMAKTLLLTRALWLQNVTPPAHWFI